MRGRPHSRLLTWSFLASLLLHLSAITLFRVVIFFPRQDIQYVEFHIVQAAAPPAPADEPGQTPADADSRGWTRGGLQLGGERLYETEGPPPVDLPTLEFAELNRLRVRRDALLDPERREAIFGEEPRDSWRRFGDELARVRESLSSLALSGTADEEAAADLRRDGPRMVHRPAEGFEAYVEWESEPRDRELLFAPPMEALWDIAPDKPVQPISLVIEVSAMGRVINVWSPALDSAGVLDRVQVTVLKYRFEPLDDPTAMNQMGTLHIARARGAP